MSADSRTGAAGGNGAGAAAGGEGTMAGNVGTTNGGNRSGAGMRNAGANPQEAAAVNCVKCEHYHVTWDPSFPRGCRLFGFKTLLQPSATVYEATGAKCKNYKVKSAS